MEKLIEQLEEIFEDANLVSAFGELTLTVDSDDIIDTCLKLRDKLEFDTLVDLCGVDYSTYGGSAWLTKTATDQGFSRAVDASKNTESVDDGYRYAVVYHLLSLQHNQRLRVKVRLDADSPIIDSVTAIWESAGWFEREAFDLFGILFDGHQDLRRILTDYGFIGHPFRKDFPLIGNVEMRYDADKKRVVYEPVSIQERILVPRVIRDDNRYEKGQS